MRLLAYLAALAVAVGAMHLNTQATISEVERREDAAFVESCLRGNILRADRRIDARDPDDLPAERRRIPVIFPILDCERTAAKSDSIPVALPREEAVKFIELVRQHRVPSVDDSRVVGSRPFAVERP